jgi:undecaprenyl diphosphate synthase
MSSNTATAVPRHVAIIMDGNGRWATARGMRRSRGHRAGVDAAKRIVLESISLGIECLTLYAFSTENWRRSKQEVSFLMGLVARHLRTEYDFYRENNVRVRHLGNLDGLPDEVRREIVRVTRETADNTAMTVNLAINYGGRDEIVRAVNRWIEEHEGEEARLEEADLRAHLDLADTPELDVLIRTGGQQRISNFLLWQCAYAELVFNDRLWPEWEGADLRAAVDTYRGRKRNFGAVPGEEPDPRETRSRVAVG